MNYEEYVAQTQKASRLADVSRKIEAIEILKGLVEADIPTLDKSLTLVNIAIVYAGKRLPKEALAYYDRAIELETPLHRFEAAELKAGFLAELDRREEATAAYLDLLRRPAVTLGDRERIEQKIHELNDRQSPPSDG